MFMFRKNRANEFTPKWSVSDDIYDGITLNADCTSADTLGFVTSPSFGPAKGWHQLKWRGSTIDSQAGDLPTVDVIGVDAGGTESVLF